MEKREINPTPWMQGFGMNHGIEVTSGSRVLYLSGQVPTDSDGAPMHAGDLVAQFGQAWSNIKDCLAAADMGPENVVRMNMYTTDVDGFMANASEMVPLFSSDGCAPTSTLLGVDRLFAESVMIELEVTAVA